MSKTKQEYLESLVKPALAIEKKLQLVEERTRELQRMALLSKQGKQSTQEFKDLKYKHFSPSVVGFDDELHEIARIAKQLKRYSWT